MNGSVVKKNIVFVGFVNDYDKLSVSSLENINEFNVYHLNISNKKLKNISFFSVFFAGIYAKKCFLKEIKKIQKNVKVDLIIFKDERFYIDLVDFTRIRKVVLLRNVSSQSLRDKIKGVTTYSFDSNECKQYGFKRYDQYAAGVDYILENKFRRDYRVSFVGEDKGRYKLIKDIKTNLKGHSSNFHIVKNCSWKRRLYEKITLKKQKFERRLNYYQYLELQLNCDIVLDLVQKNQAGETMRLVEALAAGRKVITNNKSILNHTLYCSDNILYFNDASEIFEKIDSFVSRKFDSSVSLQIDKYSPKYILSQIIHNECL